MEELHTVHLKIPIKKDEMFNNIVIVNVSNPEKEIYKLKEEKTILNVIIDQNNETMCEKEDSLKINPQFYEGWKLKETSKCLKEILKELNPDHCDWTKSESNPKWEKIELSCILETMKQK